MENKNETDDLTYVSTLTAVSQQGGIPDSEGGLGIRSKLPSTVSSETVKSALNGALSELSSQLSEYAENDKNAAFQLDEVEVNVQITQEGKANIIVGEIGGKAAGGFKLKWRLMGPSV